MPMPIFDINISFYLPHSIIGKECINSHLNLNMHSEEGWMRLCYEIGVKYQVEMLNKQSLYYTSTLTTVHRYMDIMSVDSLELIV